MHSALRRAAVVPRITNQLAVARQSTSTALAPSDHSYDKPLEKLGDPSKRAFSYLVLGGARFIYASATRLIAMKFIASMSASADVLALASTEVDLSKIDEGSSLTVKWRGKPVFVRHRDESEIAAAVKADKANLVDPQNDADRVKDPAWLVTVGVCTHLGCVPLAGAGDFGGYFCPCHGSHYDTSGRIRKGPAPLNLDIPPYEINTEEESLLIG
jgi:ubiquinol-cytochrome c reductase iron-sulfur subunit